MSEGVGGRCDVRKDCEVKRQRSVNTEHFAGAPVVDEAFAGGSNSFCGMSLLLLGLGNGWKNCRNTTTYCLLVTLYS